MIDADVTTGTLQGSDVTSFLVVVLRKRANKQKRRRKHVTHTLSGPALSHFPLLVNPLLDFSTLNNFRGHERLRDEIEAQI